MDARAMRVGVWIVLLAMGLGSAATTPVAAGDERDQGEIGIQGGFFLPDRDLSGKPEQAREIESQAGLRGAWLFADRWGWFVDATLFDINTAFAGDADGVSGRTGIQWFSRPHWERSQWFVAAGGGALGIELEDPAPGTDGSFDRTFASLGFGQRFALDRRAHLRWELRGDRTLEDDGLGGADVSHVQFFVGVSWGLGVYHEDPDSDGDGVPDSRDDCPGTPAGARVDARGCPLDSDGDRVFDGIDQCPATPRGATVDARGCPLDSDGDGVFDGIDRCPGTPRGATVDARGCPLDSDGDRVFDGIDQCPATPRGATVDARGCPLDSDGDRVFDGIDRCPGTPAGTSVDEVGCPLARTLFPDPEKRKLVLEGVRFRLNSAELTPASLEILDRVAESLRAWPEVRVHVNGHTDSTGTEAYNLQLSERRARAVRDYLVRHRVDPDRLDARGFGESRPIETNGTSEGRARNRRVVLERLD